MTLAEFVHYRDTTHADIVTSVPSFTRNVRHYVPSHLVSAYAQTDVAARWGRADFDGIAELWFDSTAGMLAAFIEPEVAARIAANDKNFVDDAGTQLFVLREIEKYAG